VTSRMPRRILLGIECCGCITLVDCEPSRMNEAEERSIIRRIRDGGSTAYVDSLDEARAMPHFMPMKCPHDPKGWEETR
jgi:hypothetical protein